MEFEETMPRRTLVVSAQGGIGKTSLALGSTSLVALCGGRAGYLGIGYSRSLCASLDTADFQAEPHPSTAMTFGVYSSRTCEAEFVIAEVEIPQDRPVANVSSHFESASSQSLARTEDWFVDWKLPFELLTESIRQEFAEIWCLRALPDTLESNLAMNQKSNTPWVEILVFPDEESRWGAGLAQDSRAGGASGIVLQRAVGPVLDGVPQVLAEPFSRNAISIASFLRGRYANEGQEAGSRT